VTDRTYTSRADVATGTPARYAKQLASHLGRRCEVRPAGEATRLVFGNGGDCLLTAGDGVLALRATAASRTALGEVEEVVGTHLARFGTRAELVVAWRRAPGSEGGDHRPGPLSLARARSVAAARLGPLGRSLHRGS
jgi:hypothetical protein